MDEKFIMKKIKNIDSKIVELELFKTEISNKLLLLENSVLDIKNILKEMESPSLFRIAEYEKELEETDRRISIVHSTLLKIIPKIEMSTEKIRKIVEKKAT